MMSLMLATAAARPITADIELVDDSVADVELMSDPVRPLA